MHRHRAPVALMLLLAALIPSISVAEDRTSTNAKAPDFIRDVQPILGQKCERCHGDRVQKGELNLASLAGIRTGGESGDPAIGETLDESLLWYLVESDQMPPDGASPLTDDQKSVLRDWIQSVDLAELADDSDAALNQHDVLPIVLLRCVTCHGAQRIDGGLDLRTVETMKTGGTSGPAIIAGDPDHSLMIQRIESEACPPSDLLLKFFVRRPSSAETTTIREWIAQGAVELPIEPDVADGTTDALVTDSDRQHWAFQKINDETENWKHDSIDGFVQHRLNEQGLQLSKQADRDTLIRRAYFDLIGLPPTLKDLDRWRNNPADDWYAQLVDELLDSPRYGERWGRYWLDLAGYADSEGGISADPLRPVAWKYRDYVIGAFNEDKPYDKFLIEQLAGDELVDYQNATEITDEMVDHLIATGFLRMGIDETGSRTMNFVPERLKVIGDAINVVSTSLMGLTMECARCHSHKYDPIPQRDYYRLKAIFQGALDEHDWHSFKTRKINLGTEQQRELAARINPPLEKQVKRLQSQQKALVKQVQLDLLRHHYPDQTEQDNETTIKALRIADNNRTLPQRTLVEKLQQAELLPDDQQPESVLQGRQTIESLRQQINQIRQQMAPTLQIRALWDQGRPSPTYLLQRGEHTKPGRLVGPGVPAVLTDGKTQFTPIPPFPNGTAKTGRRLAFAQWLTNPDHPLTARVMVNRIWHHHFGRGIVTDLGNFGRQSPPPSHPELLDWLATQFVQNGWSVKQIHRLIMNSETYRQTSRVDEQLHQADPQNKFLSRMNMRRLDAEALRDSLLFVSGKLDERAGGIPDTVSVDRDGLVSVDPTENRMWRRSVYLQFRRTEIPTMMDTFDYPPMGPNCLTRNVSVVSPQALMLMNNGQVYELAKAFADRVQINSPKDIRSQITTAYAMLLSRSPSKDEMRLSIETITELENLSDGDRQNALETYCHTLFNSAAALYVD